MTANLLLVDGSSFLYRAFHALPDLRSPRGEPTGAIYGIVNMLKRLRVDHAADYAACIFDGPGKTFRDDLYASYKANRSAMPDALVAQIEPIREIVPALGWPTFTPTGIEADDMIATLADQAQARGWSTMIATGDKDLAQLVSPRIRLVNTMSRPGASPGAEILDEAGVQQKFGVPASLIVEYLMLTGDAVDNVPGVEKVGPKTAAKWLSEYGSLEALIAAAPGLKGVVGENFRNAIEGFELTRQLLTVKRDCDLTQWLDGLEALKFRDPDSRRLYQVYRRFDFRTWTRELIAADPGLVDLPSNDEASEGSNPADSTRSDASHQASHGETASLGAAGVSALGSNPSGGGAVSGSGSTGLDPSTAPATAGGHYRSTVEPLGAALLASLRAAYRCVLDEAGLVELLAAIESADVVAIDSETTSLDAIEARIVGLSFAVLSQDPPAVSAPALPASMPNIKAWYLPLGHHYAGAPDQLDFDATLARLKPWLESDTRRKVGQHLKYDAQVLANHGIHLAGIIGDTLLESYVLEAHLSHGLDALAKRHLGWETIAYEAVAGKGASQIPFSQVAVADACVYAAEDADVCLRLHHVLSPRLEREPQLLDVYQRIELPVSEVLRRVERNGVLIDREALVHQSASLAQRMGELEAQAYALAGQPFNLGSPKQIGEILFDKQGLPIVKKTASGAPSTDEDVLVKLAEDYPLPKILLEHRSLAKLKGTYTDKLPKMINPQTGRVHTHFSQAVAVTGRLASSDPNLQNIPIRTPEGRRVREAFIAPEGSVIVSADYSQIELRIMAHISQDPGLLAAFAEGLDVHRATASEIFGCPANEVTSEQRRYAKVINFGLIYGMGAFGLASNLGISQSDAKRYIERYFARYPGVDRYMKATREQARQRGYVETVFGRRLWLPEINSPNGPRRQGAERAAINAPMQGTAADLIKLAMIAVQGFLDRGNLRSKMILQVHDELVFEVPLDEREALLEALPGLMQGVADLSVPLLVEVGEGANWDQAH